VSLSKSNIDSTITRILTAARHECTSIFQRRQHVFFEYDLIDLAQAGKAPALHRWIHEATNCAQDLPGATHVARIARLGSQTKNDDEPRYKAHTNA